MTLLEIVNDKLYNALLKDVSLEDREYFKEKYAEEIAENLFQFLSKQRNAK